VHREDQLERKMRLHMLRAMPNDPTGALAALDLRSLVHDYVTWRSRVPAAFPRNVHLSDALLANPARRRYSEGLAATLRELAFGHELRPRMSTAVLHASDIEVPAAVTRRPRRRKDRDLLLAEWGIHHLHLSVARGRHPDFVRRTDHVLFVAFRRNDAYLLDLRRHEANGDNWAAKDLLEIAVRNWADGGILDHVESAIGLEGDEPTDEQRRTLREAGVNLAVEIDGRVYLPPGQTLDGAPLAAARHAMLVRATLDALRTDPEWREAALRDAAERHDVAGSAWRPIVHGEEFGYVNAGVFVPFGSLTP
jgi:hypothetical protein